MKLSNTSPLTAICRLYAKSDLKAKVRTKDLIKAIKTIKNTGKTIELKNESEMALHLIIKTQDILSHQKSRIFDEKAELLAQLKDLLKSKTKIQPANEDSIYLEKDKANIRAALNSSSSAPPPQRQAHRPCPRVTPPHPPVTGIAHKKLQK
ncbi:hypothetical protein V8U11_05905 [Pseudomonas chlororaphis]|uniref:hypothetical protein n=1 Tax=Pseudomonas chlororaphis TaxID=587753 RepID=UPI0030D00C38